MKNDTPAQKHARKSKFNVVKRIAYAETRSLHSLAAILAISEKSQNPELARELCEHIGDTRDTNSDLPQKTNAPSPLLCPSDVLTNPRLEPQINPPKNQKKRPSAPEMRTLSPQIQRAQASSPGASSSEMHAIRPKQIMQSLQKRDASSETNAVQANNACDTNTLPDSSSQSIPAQKNSPQNQNTPCQMVHPFNAVQKKQISARSCPPQNHSSLPNDFDLDGAMTVQTAVAIQLDSLAPSSASDETQELRDDSHELEIGAIVDHRYEILSEIASGGFGVVYRARQIGIDRIVALKRLHSHDNEAASQRFLREANIIKNLIHPNTIHLIDAGIDHDHLYLVMEYVKGHSLRHLIDHEKIDPLRAIHIAQQILKSLHEAHECDIIHRDIKPSNIIICNIIGEPDYVKVLDFGIAKVHVKNGAKLTQAGRILGTPQYIAPELLFGSQATRAVDIFAVGIVLFEMLTGNSPLPNSPIALLDFVASGKQIEFPEQLQQTELEPILRCALNQDPTKRYPSAIHMIQDLNRAKMRLTQSKHEKSPIRRFLCGSAIAFFIITNLITLYFLIDTLTSH